MKRPLKVLRWRSRTDPDTFWRRPPPNEALGWWPHEYESLTKSRAEGEERRAWGIQMGTWPWSVNLGESR